MTELIVVSGGLREPSSTRLLADRLAASTTAHLREQELPTTIRVIELRTLARSIADAMVTGFATAELEEAFTSITTSDGMIAVTPAFNASYSGLFKSFFDVLPEETLTDLPVLVGATGGTDRHSLVLEHAMRPMFSYLHAIVSPTGVYASTDDFGAGDRRDTLGQRIDKAGEDYARLLTSCGRRKPRDTFNEDFLAMEELLRQPPS
jgi:FMN reductase